MAARSRRLETCIMATLVKDLTEDQEAEIEKFAAEECARMAKREAKNAKRKQASEKEDVVGLVQEFVRKQKWPDSSTAKNWLQYKADPTHKMGLGAGASLVSIASLCLPLHARVLQTDLEI